MNAWLVALIACMAGAAPPSGADNPYLVQGRVLYQGMKYEQALARLEKALTWNRTTTAEIAEVQLFVGMCRFQLGDSEAARRAFRIAVSLDANVTPPSFTSPKILEVFKEELAAHRVANEPAIEPPVLDPKPAAPVEPAPPSALPAPVAAVAPKAPELQSSAPSTTHRIWPGAATVGAAAILAGAGGAVGLQARSQHNDAAKAQVAVNAASLSSSATSNARNANILFGTAAGVAAVGLVFFFVF
jgi:tetratricopeptide (TPR) repeat protein